MINKFQQGGQADLAIMLFVLGIAQELQADPQLVVLAAQQNPEALKAAVQVFLKTQDIKLAAQTFALAIQQKTQAAKHGAKLNYIKSLKHQCAEDEEVYYFKKGGSVGCGCRKKEDGGEVTKAQKGTAVDKFKNRKVQTDFSKDEKEYFKGNRPANAGDAYSPSERGKKPISLEPAQKKPVSLKPVSKVKNEDANAGDEYSPSARGKKPIVKKSCGSKLKKHQIGGFFYLPPTLKENYQPVTMSPNVSYPQNIKIKPVTKEPYVVKPQKTLLDKAKNFYNEFKKRAAEQNNKRQELNKVMLNSYGIGKYDPFEEYRNKVY